MKKNELRIGSVMKDLNGAELTVIGFKDIFTIATYDVNSTGAVYLVPSHLEHYELVKY